MGLLAVLIEGMALRGTTISTGRRHKDGATIYIQTSIALREPLDPGHLGDKLIPLPSRPTPIRIPQYRSTDLQRRRLPLIRAVMTVTLPTSGKARKRVLVSRLGTTP